MANVFRTGFDIAGRPGEEEELFNQVVAYTRRWARASYELPQDFVDGTDHRGNQEGDLLRIDSEQGEEEAYFHLKADRDGCSMDFRLAARGDEVQATLEVRLSEEDARPAAAPRFLADLVNEFRCQVAGEEISPNPLRLTAETAPTFAEELVFNPERKLPLVLISGENGYPNSLLSSARLAGLARVVICPDALVDTMNTGLEEFRCFRGTIRLYWPQCIRTELHWSHPFWSTSRLRPLGQEFYPRLRDDLISYLAMRFEWSLFADVADSIRSVQHQQDLIRSTEAAEQQALEVLADREVELQAENERYKQENQELRTTVFYLRQRINALEGRFDSEEEIAEASTEDLQEFRSVTGVLDRAASELESVRILDCAIKSARNFQFPNRNRIWDVFLKMEECARVLKENGGSLGVSHEQWFQQEGVDFAASESDTTMSKHATSRTFADAETGTSWEMPAHFKLGGNQLRIHVLWLEDEGRWLVGHVGAHLPTGRS